MNIYCKILLEIDICKRFFFILTINRLSMTLFFHCNFFSPFFLDDDDEDEKFTDHYDDDYYSDRSRIIYY